ncbi:hypothetical protein ACFPN0_16550 [Kitasatospora cinereorecta]
MTRRMRAASSPAGPGRPGAGSPMVSHGATIGVYAESIGSAPHGLPRLAQVGQARRHRGHDACHRAERHTRERDHQALEAGERTSYVRAGRGEDGRPRRDRS